ncbi:thiol:disulfide interchange protein DsbA/DsbL [Ramlibacter sp. WS9]|uniref:thiol:disulfide interchange protein DsbA/DsbL n=1 Tax=Ramlibacter sp. WS9 TaxID=1882741 RepID=UPI001144C92C|nr:thiol:disulfide interchange protein DsbA/DsbL [Ramlibacter sp. WS9]ROZ78258.1 thiol:disulfide interchange protein DsbA/DsbL [Ramlibacter sp. WS9]
MTSRRHICTFAVSSLFGVHLGASGQDRLVEGQHYVPVSPRQRTRSPQQIEVIEFFAYSCSHCSVFEPALDAWQKKLPGDVLFRRIPVAFRPEYVIHQALYFAIEALGLVEQLHRKVFHSNHEAHPHQHLDNADDIAAFVAKNGVDRSRFIETMNSFSVAAKIRQANQLAEGYKIEGTPSLGVDGRWLTSGSLAGSNQRSLLVADYLIAQARKVR